MEICLNCYSVKTYRKDKNIICTDCANTQNISSYLRIQRQAKDAIRNGYLYRVRLENNKKRKVTSTSYSLIDLNEVFNFFATAAISGIAGNVAYDQIKKLFKTLGKKRIIIEIDDKRLQSFLKSESQQKKFIKYIQEYKQKKIKTNATPQKKKVKKVKTPPQKATANMKM
ncbi:MAG: hypothetical protein IPH18_06050 [Chitinophagaceae bacterium]|nr:hypothetical protein [Chitinophagaceae bacterium]